MKQQTYRKLDLAAEYLEVAAELLYAEKYPSCLALAGMAEEIFDAVIQSKIKSIKDKVGPLHHVSGMTPILNELIKEICRIIPNANADKLRRSFNRAKNKAKHATGNDRQSFELEITFNPKSAAVMMLMRAVLNYIRLGYEPEGRVGQFCKELRTGASWVVKINKEDVDANDGKSG